MKRGKVFIALFFVFVSLLGVIASISFPIKTQDDPLDRAIQNIIYVLVLFIIFLLLLEPLKKFFAKIRHLIYFNGGKKEKIKKL